MAEKKAAKKAAAKSDEKDINYEPAPNAKAAKAAAEQEGVEGALLRSKGLSERSGMSEPMTPEQINDENAPSTER